MIDARDHVGVPVITNCPLYVRHSGVTYEVAADALVVRIGKLTVDTSFFQNDAFWVYGHAAQVVTPSRVIFSTGA